MQMRQRVRRSGEENDDDDGEGRDVVGEWEEKGFGGEERGDVGGEEGER